MAAASHDYGTLNKSKNVIPDHCDFTDYVNWAVYPVIFLCVCNGIFMLFSSSFPVVKAHILIQKKKKTVKTSCVVF